MWGQRTGRCEPPSICILISSQLHAHGNSRHNERVLCSYLQIIPKKKVFTVEKVWLGPGYGLIYKYSDFKVNTDIVNWHLEASPNHHRQYWAWGQSDGGKRYVENCQTQRCCTLLIPVYCTGNVWELYMQSQTDVVCVKFVQFYLMLS